MWLTMPAGGELAVTDGPLCEARGEGFELLGPAGTADKSQGVTRTIPTGFQPKAQGCGNYPGSGAETLFNPIGGLRPAVGIACNAPGL